MPGFGEMCVSGQHESCADRDCRCLCHENVRKMVEKSKRPVSSPVFGNLVCPQCDRVPRAGDQFCRADGTRLISGKICRCGKSAEPDDKFCGGCGQLFGPPAVPVKELSDEEIAALEAQARQRPSDVEAPPQEVH